MSVIKKLPKITPEEVVIDADKSLQEVQEIFAKNNAGRQENLKAEIHWIFIWLLRVAAVILGALFIVRVWHMVAPINSTWLNNEQIQEIDALALVFSGAVGGYVAKYLESILPNKNS